jgi:hypothetical protein
MMMGFLGLIYMKNICKFYKALIWRILVSLFGFVIYNLRKTSIWKNGRFENPTWGLGNPNGNPKTLIVVL